MRKRLRYLSLPLLAACGSIAACSSDPDPAPTPPGTALAAQLEKDTGTKWTVFTDPRSREIRFLAPATAVQIDAGSPEQKARAFFGRYAAALHSTASTDELQLVSTAVDARGGTHIRFSHTLPGTRLPVFGSGTTAHFTAAGAVYWLQTDFRADLADLDASAATLTKDMAISKALAHVKATCGASPREPVANDAELGVHSDPERPAALAYRVRVFAQSERCVAPSVFIDAASGKAIEIEERAHAAAATNVHGSRYYRANEGADVKTIDIRSIGTQAAPRYAMVSEDAPGERVITKVFGSESPIETSNPREWDPTPASPQGAAVDAQFYIRLALPFLRQFAGRSEAHNWLPGSPLWLDVHAFVHDNGKSNDFGANATAIYDSDTGRDVVYFGDGNFPAVANALPWSAAYDVVAHELAHLITDHTSALKYEKESARSTSRSPT